MKRRLLDLPRNWVGLLVSVIFWCMLWGGIDAKNVLGGILAATIVFVMFPMPPTGHEITIRPLRFVYFVSVFLFDMVKSAIEVGWYSIRPAPQPLNSVIAVKLRSRSDLFLTGTGMLSTLIPGSVVVEAQRATGTLFLHVIAAEDEEQAEQARQRVLEQEERLLWAMARREILEEAGLR